MLIDSMPKPPRQSSATTALLSESTSPAIQDNKLPCYQTPWMTTPMKITRYVPEVPREATDNFMD
jgi:hypothetical protein